MDNQKINSVLVLNPSPQTIQIISHAGNALGMVEITDVQGRTLIREANVSDSTYNYQTVAQGVYIVRVNGETGKIVVK